MEHIVSSSTNSADNLERLYVTILPATEVTLSLGTEDPLTANTYDYERCEQRFIQPVAQLDLKEENDCTHYASTKRRRCITIDHYYCSCDAKEYHLHSATL